jgi:hypothetical protein
MSTRRKMYLAFILAIIFRASLSHAQQRVTASDFGGGPDQFHSKGGFTEEIRAEIKAKLKKNIEKFKAQGILKFERMRSAEPLVVYWPLKSTLSDYGYYRVGHLPDHDENLNSLLDYMGGDRTYDREGDGYNHRGTDIYGWPFDWQKMDNNEVQVVAAAAGIIALKEDGNYDRECATLTEGNLTFNSIWILHYDNSWAWYAHFKNGSLTTKEEGETVEVGEYLGVIGSSGWSWEPHLHFELEDSLGNMVDPNIGPYNPNPSITWAEGVQRPYYDCVINKVMTHSAPPDFMVPCPNPTIINAQDYFYPGNLFYVAAYYRDQLTGQTSQYTIYRPDNTVFQTWTHTRIEDPPHPSQLEPDWSLAAYWCWEWTLPSDAPEGNWKFEVVYEGQTYEHNFFVKALVPIQLSSFTANAGNGFVNLTWTTQSEMDLFGFNIYRSDNDSIQWRRINSELIYAARFSTTPRTYSYVDERIQALGTCYYRLECVDVDGKTDVFGPIPVTIKQPALPTEFGLSQNYPNPFNSLTEIKYQLPKPTKVVIKIYGLLGQEICTLVNGEVEAGLHSIHWDGTDIRGNQMSSGAYILVMRADNFTSVQKMSLVR